MNQLLSKKVTASLAVGLLSVPATMSLLSVMPYSVGSVVPINSQRPSSKLQQQTDSTSPIFQTAHATTYTVRSGDSLSAIAARFHVTVSQLVQWNHIANPNRISVGQVLHIGQTASASATSHASASASSSTTQYTVQSGNTLSIIAAKFGLSWQSLASFNHLSNPNVLQVGEVLKIPGKRAASSTSAQLPTHSASVSFNQAIVKTAEQQLGIPYVWGGASPSTGFDCSGLVQYVFRQNGVPMPRTSWAQYAFVHKISKSQLQPGDLVFFQTAGPGASHVGIYIGSYPKLGYSQAFIEAPEPGQNVQVSNLNDPFYISHYYGAGQVNP